MAGDESVPKPKYIWDRDKLAWVEATEPPVDEESLPQTGTAEIAYEEALEEFSAEFDAVEAVEGVEGLQYRGAWIRLFGMFIDLAIIFVISLVVNLAFGTGTTVVRIILPVVGVLYFCGFWTLRGQTPGKMAIGAKIVKANGSPIGLGRALLRYFVYFIYISAYSIGLEYTSWVLPVIVFTVAFFSIALSREKRGLHDRIAGTAVINSRPSPLEDYEEEEYFEAEEEYDALEAR